MRRHGLNAKEILPSLKQFNKTRCVPPLSDKEVASVAQSVSRYDPDEVAVAVMENHFGQDFGGIDDERPIGKIEDVGTMPLALLRVNGFINEVMDYTLKSAPYPNIAMAFCGALAVQAYLCGRKVRDECDKRTNLYLLGLAHSSAGKDWPRKVNTRIKK